jgi:RHS repeat-associated protein
MVNGREPALSGGEVSSVAYQYDEANRLTSVDGVNYSWDANGNLLSDGTNTYTYDSANRLTAISGPPSETSQQSATYAYNGLGDRLAQNGVQYTLDLNAGLTQVLADGTNTYLYGNGRISQTDISTEYFLGDALGSVRQLANNSGEITLTKNYDPYGNNIQSLGAAQTDYGFTGETTDANGLIYLRARFYAPADGRFTSRDTFAGYLNLSQSQNRYIYVHNNPIRYTDPTGHSIPAPFFMILVRSGMQNIINYVFNCDNINYQ